MDPLIKTAGNETLSSAAVGFGISLAVASVASALLVVAKERSPALMAFMKSATGHHWSAHTVFALAIFLILGAILSRLNGGRGVRVTPAGLIQTVVTGIVLGSVIIGGYYLFLD
jgi:hypothetical protein